MTSINSANKAPPATGPGDFPATGPTATHPDFGDAMLMAANPKKPHAKTRRHHTAFQPSRMNDGDGGSSIPDMLPGALNGINPSTIPVGATNGSFPSGSPAHGAPYVEHINGHAYKYNKELGREEEVNNVSCEVIIRHARPSVVNRFGGPVQQTVQGVVTMQDLRSFEYELFSSMEQNDDVRYPDKMSRNPEGELFVPVAHTTVIDQNRTIRLPRTTDRRSTLKTSASFAVRLDNGTICRDIKPPVRFDIQRPIPQGPIPQGIRRTPGHEPPARIRRRPDQRP